jgi:serine phosphatase RsbU (regulator of sigma subunit)
MKSCTMCNKEYDETAARSEYAQAGEWLAGEVWHDAGELCPLCLESRARLVMMYCHEYNT